ncbi:histidine phosphatase family protein [Fusobacterium russii]|uniref:histidine phosphatase family protein n=1 Tax=Fusobacterium russii TaxID=854 RepID=UPI0003AA73CE|nr:histidine phosphatase family protein [Fusobacterium russii]
MGKLILVRHGETDLNKNKIYFGKLNPGLNETGKEQIKKTKEKLLNYRYDFIYSSPLLRAKQSAEICNYLNLPINYSDNLRELDFGVFEGLTFDEIQEKYPNEVKKAEKEWKTYNFETGEAPNQMYLRVMEFLKSLNFEKDNLIVAHWGVLNSILSHYLANELDGYWKYKFENGGIAILEGSFEFSYLIKFM